MDIRDECRVYVDHIIAEHRRLHRMLRTARAAIVASHSPDRDAQPEDIARILRQVREELAHHFREEEAGGCLEEAVSRHPSLATEEQRIEAEHPQLLEAVDRQIALALDSDGTVEKRVALERGFDDLCRQLDAHEAAENVLLRKGFGIIVNGEESGQAALVYDD